MSMGDVPPRDCALSLLRVLCCHTPCAISTAKHTPAWERCRGDALMDLATVDKLLTTTRTVRKRLDCTRSVDPEIIQTCLEIAIQAPTGGNIPRYHFVVVTDEAKRAALAALYQRAYVEVYSPQRQEEVRQSDPRLIDSATYLAEHMHEVPVLIIPCVEAPVLQGTGPGAYASILPATWSLMLALRARGVGSAWTTLHLRYEQEAAALLVTACNPNGSGLQSPRLRDHIHCNYRPLQDRIHCN